MRAVAARPGLVLAALGVGAWLGGVAPPAAAHVTVGPTESEAGVVLRYALIVPGERAVPTTRVEVQFPDAVRVTEIQTVPGWRATAQKDRAGRLVGAIWEGGTIPLEQFVEFGVLARNPDATVDLTWKAIQTYEDGREVHWVGPPGSEFPGPVTRVRPATPASGTVPRLAGSALIVALAAAAGAGLAWRRAGRSAAPRSG